MFFAKLLPREGNFFELFDQHAAFITQAARAFMQLIENYADPQRRERHMRLMRPRSMRSSAE